MKCPFCGEPDTKVLDSRATDEGTSIRRRRECPRCGQRFTTYERIEKSPLVVVKKDGRREAFEREKLLRGILKACEKRPIPLSRLEEAVDHIEKELAGRLDSEIPSSQIGEMVMDALKDLDPVAYVRFASVYRQFKDIENFRNELERLLK
jgi:transcriptional repressor NrdR